MPTTFPDVETLVRDYLAAQLTVPVFVRVPPVRPPQWVQVRRFGGTKILVRDQANLDFNIWDVKDEIRCFGVASQVRSLIHDLQGTSTLGPMVYTVEEFAGLSHSDDADSSDLVYSFSATMTVRAN